jgi:hypothetical protein
MEVSNRGSKATRCLEKTWQLIRRIEPCLPSVVIVILAASRSNKRKMGHLSPCAWQSNDTSGAHEMAINPVLFNSAEDLLHTMLHEAAHALLHEWGLKGGCGPDGYYHREEFRNVCIKLGLACQFNNKRYGWNVTSWPKTGVPTRYAGVLTVLREEIPAGRKNMSRPLV